MRRRPVNLQSLQHFGHRHMRKRPPTTRAWTNEIARHGIMEIFEDGERALGQRNTMLAPGLHATGRNGPDSRLKIDFRPSRTIDFAGPRRRQNGEFERHCGDGIAFAQPGDESWDVPIIHRCVMAAREPPVLRQEV